MTVLCCSSIFTKEAIRRIHPSKIFRESFCGPAHSLLRHRPEFRRNLPTRELQGDSCRLWASAHIYMLEQRKTYGCDKYPFYKNLPHPSRTSYLLSRTYLFSYTQYPPPCAPQGAHRPGLLTLSHWEMTRDCHFWLQILDFCKWKPGAITRDCCCGIQVPCFRNSQNFHITGIQVRIQAW